MSQSAEAAKLAKRRQLSSFCAAALLEHEMHSSTSEGALYCHKLYKITESQTQYLTT